MCRMRLSIGSRQIADCAALEADCKAVRVQLAVPREHCYQWEMENVKNPVFSLSAYRCVALLGVVIDSCPFSAVLHLSGSPLASA